ncbi:hypothetical protein pEaSNUABM8_00089 [Erwinia phage pEa_SNUABM_8]|nr:hypothetical protein pEaSNUABM8_00089 [Erwinia phage pEa_SNUABM_8]QVW54841.1 hypothetical protein pEaSNUABM4_00088 [Erwinia phage pEa_SNUABM_4]
MLSARMTAQRLPQRKKIYWLILRKGDELVLLIFFCANTHNSPVPTRRSADGSLAKQVVAHTTGKVVYA